MENYILQNYLVQKKTLADHYTSAADAISNSSYVHKTSFNSFRQQHDHIQLAEIPYHDRKRMSVYFFSDQKIQSTTLSCIVL